MSLWGRDEDSLPLLQDWDYVHAQCSVNTHGMKELTKLP